MPKRLPLKDVLSGLISSIATAVRFWVHYTVVAIAWLGIVPLSACRIHRSLFTGSVNSIFALPLDLVSTYVDRPLCISGIFQTCRSQDDSDFCSLLQREYTVRHIPWLHNCYVHSVCIHQPGMVKRAHHAWRRS